MVPGHLDKKERFLRKLTRVTASIDVVDAKNTPSKFLICREIEKNHLHNRCSFVIDVDVNSEKNFPTIVSNIVVLAES
jgi:hypothetical protein